LVGEAVSGGFGPDGGNRDGFELSEDGFDLLTEVSDQIGPEGVVNLLNYILNHFSICPELHEFLGHLPSQLKRLTIRDSFHSFFPNQCGLCISLRDLIS
jgi:hypothetical protein